jgi:hypothetical protein
MSADDIRNDERDLDASELPPDRARQVDRDIQRDAQQPSADRLTDREVARPAARDMGDLEGAERTALFEPTQLTEFKGRWSEIQAGFVDEPRRAVQQADALVSDVISRIADSFGRERTALEQQWDRGGDVSTEDLRQALQRYRSFFSRLLTL